MKLAFTKMHGLGNDFVVIDAIRQSVALSPEQCRFLADRHFGVGCDQILLVETPTRAGVDFRYRIFNADGGEVQQCGNGARCFVRFVHDKKLSDNTKIHVETASGVIVPRLENDGQVTVDMGPPRFEPSEIPFIAEARADLYVLDDLPFSPVELFAVSMGNPHAVLETCNVDTAPVAEWGPLIERHPRFPERVNVGFMQLLHRRAIRLRVFERGSGETLACGTGACAAAVAGMRRGLLEHVVDVQTRGGSLTIRWDGPGHSVFMTGPAATVFEGEIEL
jgi:diaminopimelate epimerase